ncbi:hypothetical protein [Pantoea septica]|uniref:hypothetical protein n=1 Tax=Pantoea septica TaxID=472695 RepID=UPI00289632E3|nr:hypothetical protein [Pantoea septica]
MSQSSSSKFDFQDPKGLLWLLDKLFNYRAREFYLPMFQVVLFFIASILFMLFFHLGLIDSNTEVPHSLDRSWYGLIYLLDLRLESAIAYKPFRLISVSLGVIFVIGFIAVGLEEKLYKYLWVIFFSVLSVGCAGVSAMGGAVFLLSIIVFAINNHGDGFILMVESVGLIVLSFGIYAILRQSFITFFEKVVVL